MLYRIAQLNVDMQPRYALLQQRAAPYQTAEGCADMVLREQDAPPLAETLDDPQAMEYALLGAAFYDRLPAFDGLLLHASAVELNGRAYAFSAPCGTGKSTHAALWKRVLGAEILNDDKPALRLIDGRFCACGTPFSGKTAQNRNRQVPLDGICFLQRGTNAITRLDTATALWQLLNQTRRFTEPHQQNRLLDLLDTLLRQVPMYRLSCDMTEQAAHVAYEGMKRP